MDVVTQPDYLDGTVVNAGTDEIHLSENGTIHRCTASAEVAGRLSAFLNRGVVRAFGTAAWMRNEAGIWQLRQFSIEEFMPLEDINLAEAIAQLDEKNRSH
jgi:hypothetical protein